MTLILLKSQGLFIIFFYLCFFIHYLFHIVTKIFVREKRRNFGEVGKIFPDKKFLPDKTFPDKVIFFTKICCDVVKNKHCYQFLCKGLKGFPRKTFPRISWIWLSLVKLHSLKIF